MSARGEQPAVDFESGLERDLFIILRFDLGYSVEYYSHQPLNVEYDKPNGKTYKYPIDVYFEYIPELDRFPRLIEVKYLEELRKYWYDWKPKFKAAHQVAREHGARFHIYTERHIRTPYLDNARILQEPKDRTEIPELTQRIKNRLDYLGPTTPERLLLSLSDDHQELGELKPMLWHLIAHRQIKTDLSSKLDPTRSVLELNTL